MEFREYFSLFFKSFNPKAYKFLADRFLSSSFQYLIFLFVFSFIVMLVLLAPVLLTLSSDVQEKLNQIDDFYVEGHVSVSRPVVLMEDPLVVMDFNRTYPGREKILVTKDSLFFKKYYGWGDRQLVFSDVKNVRSPEAVEVLTFLALLVVPGLLMFLFLFYGLKDALIIFLVAVLGFVVANLAKRRLSFSKSVRLAIFAGTWLVFLELILFPFWRSFWIPLLLFLVVYVWGVLEVAERRFESRPF